MSLILSGTDGLSDIDGTAATPAIRGTDANTGIFFGTDIIGFSEGGVEAMRINASGVGIGNASPTQKLDVTGTVKATAFVGDGSGLTGVSAGKVLQVVSTTKTDTFSTTSTSYVDITGMSVTITPTSASSKILVLVNMVGGSGTAAGALCTFRMVRGATAVGVGASAAGYTQASVGGMRSPDDANSSWAVNCSVLDAPATTSSTTYKVQGFIESNTLRINTTGNDTASYNFSYRGASTITVMEIAA